MEITAGTMDSKRYWHERMDRELQSIYNEVEKRNIKLYETYQKSYENMDRQLLSFMKKYGEEGTITRSEFYAYNRNLELIENMKQELQKVGYKEVKFIEDNLMIIYKAAYQVIGQDLNLLLQMDRNWNDIPRASLERALLLNVQGKHFSDRVWANKEKALKQIEKVLEESLAENLSYTRASELLAERMNVSYSDAERLVVTEMNHILTEAEANTFEEYGLKRYEIIAVMDDRTTEICRGFDGKEYNLEERAAGLNAPPFHVRCRTTIAPALDWETEKIAEVTQKEKKKPQPKKTPSVKAPDRVILRPESFPKIFHEKKAAKQTKNLATYVNGLDNADPDMLKIYNNMGAFDNISDMGIPFEVKYGKTGHAVQTSTFYGSDAMVQASIKIPYMNGDDVAGAARTTLHEMGHLVDLFNRKEQGLVTNWFSESDDFLKIARAKRQEIQYHLNPKIKAIFEEYDGKALQYRKEAREKLSVQLKELSDQYKRKEIPYAEYKKKYNTTVAAYKGADGPAMDNIFNGVDQLEDIYDALSMGRFRDDKTVFYGHGGRYYRDEKHISREIWANYSSLSITRPDLIEIIREDQPWVIEHMEKIKKQLLERMAK